MLSGLFAAVGPSAPFAFRGPMNLELFASSVSALTTTKGSLAATVVSAAGLAAGSAINSVNVPRGTTIGVLAGLNITLAPPPVTLQAIGLSVSNGLVTLPPGSNVNTLLGATVTVPSSAEQTTLPANTTVAAIVQADVAPSGASPGTPGVIRLSAAPTLVPTNNNPVPLQFAVTGNAIATTGADANAAFTGAGVIWTGSVQIERSFDGGLTYVICNVGGAGTLAQFNAGTPVSVTFGEPEKNVLYRLNCTVLTGGNINYRISQTGGAAESLAIGPLASG